MGREFRTGYMDRAVTNLRGVIDEARHDLLGVDFDTIVGTGFSGGLVIPALALELGVKFVLVRKESDDSHHGPGRLVGDLGERWIFVDDFTSSGATRRRVVEKVGEAVAGHWQGPFDTTYVGDYYYANYGTTRPRFQPFNPEDWS